MTTIVTIVGARPQFVKVAPVSRALALAGAREVLVHTGQHYDANMSEVFFEELGIAPPNYHLAIGGGGHGAMTGAMMAALEPLLEKLRPDWALVYGDTNSTLAGALTAAKLHIPVAHVEAGLRSLNRAMPEEINRVVADHLATMLFASTETAVANLAREGITGPTVQNVGDVMYDAALMFADKAGADSSILKRLGVVHKGYVLATVHRAENTDDPRRLGAIVDALEAVAKQTPVVLPLHPRTAAALRALGREFVRVKVTVPLGYLDMVALERSASVITTDSGGVQKEAFFYRVPCVTLRDETEWVELVDLGWNRLAPPGLADIGEAIRIASGSSGRQAAPYGDGSAAGRIAATLAGSG